MERRKRVPIETLEEENLREQLLRRLKRLFRDGGYDLYYQELKNYKLDVEEDLDSAPGYIDSTNRVVHIRRDVLEKAPDADISLLMRHELLHSLLRHIERSINVYATQLGIDPNSISKKDMRLIKKKMTSPMAAWQGLVSTPLAFNIGGDEHLSQYYDEIDKAVTRDPKSKLFGGLVQDDHPEWVGKSFEYILRSLIEEENALQYRLAKKVHGRYVDKDTFQVDYEEESEFETATEIMKEDIISVDLWTLSEAEKIVNSDTGKKILSLLNEYQQLVYCIKFSEDDTDAKESNKRVPAVYNGAVTDVDPRVYVHVIPIIKVRYLPHYGYLRDNGFIDCLGLTCMRLDNRTLLAVQSAVQAKLSDSQYCASYEDSNIKPLFDEWKAQKGVR